jgi:hypothetical protein
MSAVVLGLFVASLFCFYRSIELGVTTEEGLKYSVPAMRADAKYSPDFVKAEETNFRAMNVSGNHRGTLAEVVLVLSIVGLATSIWTLRSPRSSI